MADQLTELPKHNPNQELMAQGIAHALCVLTVVLVAAPLALNVPLSVLAGVLLFVVWNMGEWHAFATLRRYSFHDRPTLLGTFFSTVVFDFTIAVQDSLLMDCSCACTA